jgi:hypothetical protein
MRRKRHRDLDMLNLSITLFKLNRPQRFGRMSKRDRTAIWWRSWRWHVWCTMGEQPPLIPEE